MDWGMQNRLAKIIHPKDGRCLMLAVDHGYFLGPTERLEVPRRAINPLLPYADSLMLTRGILRTSVDPKYDIPIVLRVSGAISIIGEDLSIDARPEEVMAVFFDYDEARDFIPNCKKSRIARTINPRTHEIDYEVAVPILPDEAYTVRNILQKAEHEQLRISWSLIRATSIESSSGSMTVEPFEGRTLMCYTNLVKPSSCMASLLRGAALSQMRETFSAIAGHVLSQKQSRPAELKTQVDRLMVALGRSSR